MPRGPPGPLGPARAHASAPVAQLDGAWRPIPARTHREESDARAARTEDPPPGRRTARPTNRPAAQMLPLAWLRWPRRRCAARAPARGPAPAAAAARAPLGGRPGACGAPGDGGCARVHVDDRRHRLWLLMCVSLCADSHTSAALIRSHLTTYRRQRSLLR